MTITRREMCFLLPGLFPATAALDAFSADDNSMPSALYAFEKLPVQILDHVEMRRVLKGTLATGESLEVHETTLPGGRRPARPTPSRTFRDVAYSGRNGRARRQRRQLSSGSGGVGFVHSNDEHGIKNVGDDCSHVFCRSGWTGSRRLIALVRKV